MEQWAYIPRSELQRLFPIVICLDEAMNIVYASEKLHSYLPEVAENPGLGDVFQVLRPGKLDTFDQALQALDSLCLMTAHNGQFAIRGQLLRTRYRNDQVLCLCGAPWLFWMSRNCPEITLGLSDFSPSDVQLDQLFFMSTEKQMVADLEGLNSELTVAQQRLEEASDAQQRFFAQISHEMRTPLNGVVSALALLEANPLDNEQGQLVGLAKGSSRNLMDVINYVLDLSKLEFVGEDQHREFDLQELIRSTTDIVAARAREKSLNLALELAADIPSTCIGSASLVRQVLLNLVMNAIKFTDAGSVTIRVDKIEGVDLDCTLRFQIEDTGIGIASEMQQRIFEPFFSVQASAVQDPEAGTGLGLDIVRRNVERMGGKIGVQSEPGVGSCFWFDWPTTAVAGPVPVSIESIESIESGVGGDAARDLSAAANLSGRILLVDDNQTNLLLGSMIMETLGLEVVTVDSGAKAIGAVLEQDIDLVLMDIHMPEMDGLEATRQIRALKDSQELPILALTAMSYEREKKSCIDSGMNAYMTKPIERDALAKELAKWLPDAAAAQSCSPVAMAAGNDQAVDWLDYDVLSGLEKQIGKDNLVTVLDKVTVEAAQRWDELVAAEEASDLAAVQRHVHSLSSIFRSVGLTPGADALGEIEVQLRAGDDLSPGWLENMETLRTASADALGLVLSQYSTPESTAG